MTPEQMEQARALCATVGTRQAKGEIALSLLPAALEEIEALRRALDWYADEDNYQAQDVGAPWDDCPPEVPVLEDFGEIARAALRRSTQGGA